MSITLYGSKPSPYVRRIRMLLGQTPYTFEVIDVYDDAGRKLYAQKSPIRKLPVLQDGDQLVFDSHVIASHLINSLAMTPLSLSEHNLVSAIDAVTDSMIILFMSSRSELNTDEDRLLFRLQKERIPDCLMWLESQAKNGAFDQWGYPAIALISLIEWAKFRDLYDLEPYSALAAVCEGFSERPEVLSTKPE